jgi:hypothetical protein
VSSVVLHAPVAHRRFPLLRGIRLRRRVHHGVFVAILNAAELPPD